MKQIHKITTPHTMVFKEIITGELFEHENITYLKCLSDCSPNAVQISNGRHENINDFELVIPLKSSVTVMRLNKGEKP